MCFGASLGASWSGSLVASWSPLSPSASWVVCLLQRPLSCLSAFWIVCLIWCIPERLPLSVLSGSSHCLTNCVPGSYCVSLFALCLPPHSHSARPGSYCLCVSCVVDRLFFLVCPVSLAYQSVLDKLLLCFLYLPHSMCPGSSVLLHASWVVCLTGPWCVLGQQSHPECVLGRLPHSVYLGISVKLSESWVVSVIGCRENRNQIYMLKLDRCQLCSQGFRNRLMTSMPESTRYS